MAKAGFHYSPLKDNDDRALCFACSVTLVCWEPSDSPWTEHGRHSPQCPFIKGDFTENVPLRTTCSIQPGKKIFSNQHQQKWLIRSNELLFHDQFLLFLNCDWLVRLVDIGNVIQVRTILSLKSVIEQLTQQSIEDETQFPALKDQSISIINCDRSATKRYFNKTLIPLAITMSRFNDVDDHEHYIVFCLVHVSDTDQCLLLASTNLNHNEHLTSQTVTRSSLNTIQTSPAKSDDHDDSPVETNSSETLNSTTNKYDYLIEFSNLKAKPDQAFIYQLSKKEFMLIINTKTYLHSYVFEYELMQVNLKIISYHRVYYSATDDINVQSISPIVFDDDDDLFNNDEKSTLSNDDDDNDDLEDDEIYRYDDIENRMQLCQGDKKQKRRCYLICLKSGQMILYDVYGVVSNDEKQNESIVGHLADQETLGSISRCVHVRGTDTIYTWMVDQTVKRVS